MNSLLILAAALVAAQASPELVTVRLASGPKKGAGELRYEGKAMFPDGVVLKGTLFRSEERLTEGRLAPELTEVASDVGTVEGRRIAFKVPVSGPGLYRLVVELREDLQEPDLLPSITKSLPGKWTLDHPVWGDEFVVPLVSRLRDFDQQVDTAIDLIRRFAGATSTSQSWKDHYPALDKEVTGLLKKLDQAGLEKVYPAAALELRLTMRNLKGNAEAMVFGEDGLCRGSIDYRTQKPTKTIHSEDFTFEAIRKDLDAAKGAAGREFLLWILKDFRRSGARSELSSILGSEARRPGVGPFAEALNGFKDVDGAEKQIREGK